LFNQDYISTMLELVEEAISSQQDRIEEGAEKIADSLGNGGILHTFGSGHSAMIAKEITGRAGGLVPVNQIIDPTEGMAERVEGYGSVLLDNYENRYGMKEGEVVIVISTSGRNPLPLEIAMESNSRNLHTIAITSIEYSRQSDSRHSSGKRLFEVADTVLDNHVPPGDAIIEIDSEGQKAGPASTITGAFLINSLVLRTVEGMIDRNMKPPILRSLNLDGAKERNRELMEKYQSRLAK